MKPVARSYLGALTAFAAGTDTPRAFLERCLETLSALEPQIGAFVHVADLAAARKAADAASARWRAGQALSRIDGMPLGVKDIMETADLPTEQGSPLFAGWRTGRDAAAVAALREAGAIVIGKTVTTEFAATEPRGTKNPWDLRRTPGGSSSGSAAAVAAGMVPAALGTQVIGSILRPASYCGCYGFKPSLGGINRGGSYDNLSQSCSGVLGASLDEIWTVAREISARVGGDPGHPGLSGPMELPPAQKPSRVAVLETAGWTVASAEAKLAFETALETLRSAEVTVAWRRDDPAIEAVEMAIIEATALSRKINAWESRWPLNTYARDRDRNRLSRTMQDRLAEAEATSLEQYQAWLGERQRIRDLYAQLGATYEACLSLAAPGPAPIGLESTGNPVFVVPSSLLGVPALSLPLLEAEGLPLGFQLLGFGHEDAALLAIAAGLQNLLSTR